MNQINQNFAILKKGVKMEVTDFWFKEINEMLDFIDTQASSKYSTKEGAERIDHFLVKLKEDNKEMLRNMKGEGTK